MCGCDAVLAALTSPKVPDPVEFLAERSQVAWRLPMWTFGFRVADSSPDALRRRQASCLKGWTWSRCGARGPQRNRDGGSWWLRRRCVPLACAGSTNERLYQKLRTTVAEPLVTEAAHRGGKREGGEAGKHAMLSGNKRSGAVRNQMPAPELPPRRPDDPGGVVPASGSATLSHGMGNSGRHHPTMQRRPRPARRTPHRRGKRLGRCCPNKASVRSVANAAPNDRAGRKTGKTRNQQKSRLKS